MVPSTTHPKWKALVCGDTKYEFSSLATKIFMGRVTLSVKSDPSVENVQKKIKEVHEYFLKNEKTLQNDIHKIFG
ncbi:MAG: hypothetical protein LWX56_03390 [Ignavibacteria bacterium]|nr:hypothetical protein [Ignavibacteria bacterium]